MDPIALWRVARRSASNRAQISAEGSVGLALNCRTYGDVAPWCGRTQPQVIPRYTSRRVSKCPVPCKPRKATLSGPADNGAPFATRVASRIVDPHCRLSAGPGGPGGRCSYRALCRQHGECHAACSEGVLARISDHTDVIRDGSSLRRVMFLALLNGLLNRLIPDKLATNALAAQGDPPPLFPRGESNRLSTNETAPFSARMCDVRITRKPQVADPKPRFAFLKQMWRAAQHT
jgi:hypothetical protein